ncbi:hypothetical protein [Fodinicola feengrottensis]|uniref:hypothetical protein n=1 Tax=Fodinicola feengrottensis TaxID=435914 RepID=UPI0013D44DF3|nr:hypothetical protein [Fodinicola feengrottensis]
MSTTKRREAAIRADDEVVQDDVGAQAAGVLARRISSGDRTCGPTSEGDIALALH